MANHKSSQKRARQTVKKNIQNTARTSQVKTALRNIRNAISENNKELANKALPQVQSLLGKLAKTGIIKKETAARVTSRVAAQISKL